MSSSPERISPRSDAPADEGRGVPTVATGRRGLFRLALLAAALGGTALLQACDPDWTYPPYDPTEPPPDRFRRKQRDRT